MNSLSQLISELHSRRDKYQKPQVVDKYLSAWLEKDRVQNYTENITTLVIILRTKGCSWAKFQQNLKTDSNVGGCTMCGYVNDCIPEKQSLTGEDIIKQFKSVYTKFCNSDIQYIKLFTSGSFFDDSEIPIDAQLKIIDLINNSGIKDLLIETRPEFVNLENLKTITSKYKHRLHIALGLESCNDRILKYSINKGFLFNDYLKAIEVIKDFNILTKTYLLLKPPFLTERDAITDVMDSIKKLSAERLTNEISINPVNIQKFTVVEYLFERHEYRPPWLWSVVDILKNGLEVITNDESSIRLISQPTGGGKSRGAHNCRRCDPFIVKSLNDFSLDNDPNIFNDLHCNCIKTWQDILRLENFAGTNLI